MARPDTTTVNMVEASRCAELASSISKGLAEAERANANGRSKDARRMVNETKVLARSLLARISGI